MQICVDQWLGSVLLIKLCQWCKKSELEVSNLGSRQSQFDAVTDVLRLDLLDENGTAAHISTIANRI